MPRFSGAIGVGDVLVTREGNRLISGAIRLGAFLTHSSSRVNHVIGVHHQSPDGRWIGVEGRPGGVGYRDLTEVLLNPSTNANVGQIAYETGRQTGGNRTEEEVRFLLAAFYERLLAVAYDWRMIGEQPRLVARLNHVRRLPEWRDGEMPAHVVCSSAIDWAYEEMESVWGIRLTNPGGRGVTRMTTPGQWDDLMIRQAWRRP